MNLEGFKLSTSRNWAIWLPEYLDNYDPDPLRYVIAAGMPGGPATPTSPGESTFAATTTSS